MGRNKNKQAGYTLLELMYVVSIISLLAAMLVPQLLVQKDRIIEAQAQRRLRTIGSVMADFALGSPSGGFLEFQDLKDSQVIRDDFKLTYFIQDYSLALMTPNDRLQQGPPVGYMGMSGSRVQSSGNPGPGRETSGSLTIIAYPRPERMYGRLSTFAITEDLVVRVYKPGPGVSPYDPATWDPIL